MEGGTTTHANDVTLSKDARKTECELHLQEHKDAGKLAFGLGNYAQAASAYLHMIAEAAFLGKKSSRWMRPNARTCACRHPSHASTFQHVI